MRSEYSSLGRWLEDAQLQNRWHEMAKIAKKKTNQPNNKSKISNGVHGVHTQNKSANTYVQIDWNAHNSLLN